MKWFLILVGAILFAGIIYYQRTSVKTSYVNGLSEYNRLPGREYVFEHDCYIFKLKAHDSTWPLIGANVSGASISVPELPADVTEKNIGSNLPDVRILDVVRTGSRFKIVSVRRDESRRGVAITFEALFMDEADRKYPRVDAYWIMDHSGEKKDAAPSILQDYAVERVKK